jgi:hypothetical protein
MLLGSELDATDHFDEPRAAAAVASRIANCIPLRPPENRFSGSAGPAEWQA